MRKQITFLFSQKANAASQAQRALLKSIYKFIFILQIYLCVYPSLINSVSKHTHTNTHTSYNDWFIWLDASSNWRDLLLKHILYVHSKMDSLNMHHVCMCPGARENTLMMENEEERTECWCHDTLSPCGLWFWNSRKQYLRFLTSWLQRWLKIRSSEEVSHQCVGMSLQSMSPGIQPFPPLKQNPSMTLP